MRLKLFGASNLPGRTSQNNDVFAKVLIDGQLKATTRPRAIRWEEQFDIQVDRAQEVEIAVYSKTAGVLLAMAWFRIKDLEDDLIAKYTPRPTGINDTADTWLDLEPGGQLLIKANFSEFLI